MKFIIVQLFCFSLFLSQNAKADFIGTFSDLESVPEVITSVEVEVFNYALIDECGDDQCFRMDVILNGVHVARWATSPGKKYGHSDFPGLYTPEWNQVKFNKNRLMGPDYISGKGDSMPFASFIVYGKGGFAVHAGKVTGRYESHGCVRLQYENARLINSWIKKAFKNGGGAVISAQDTNPEN